MRQRLGLLATVIGVLVGASAALASGNAVHSVSLAKALRSTVHVRSQHYTMQVAITRPQAPTTLTIRGRSGPGALSVHVGMSAVLMDGTKIPGPDGAALVDGPFLYLRAPSSISLGGVNWLRVNLATIKPGSSALRTIRDMSPAPLLRVLGEAHVASGHAGTYSGPVAYDDPIVRAALRHLTNGLEFRGLTVTARVGRDGFVHRIELRGRTPDGSATLHLTARLFDFGKPISVTPPKPGTFMDKQLLGFTA